MGQIHSRTWHRRGRWGLRLRLGAGSGRGRGLRLGLRVEGEGRGEGECCGEGEGCSDVQREGACEGVLPPARAHLVDALHDAPDRPITDR
eukprot:1407580-Prymnesium_polylepis.1